MFSRFFLLYDDKPGLLYHSQSHVRDQSLSLPLTYSTFPWEVREMRYIAIRGCMQWD